MAISTTMCTQPPARISAVQSLFGFLRRRSTVRKSDYLDVRGLSDYMKRDLGLLDGHDPAGTVK